MINRLVAATLAIALVGGCGALALAASGGPVSMGNAAVTQYVPTQPVQPVEPAQQVQSAHEGQGVKGVHQAGGKTTSGAGRRGAQARSGPKSGSAPVETASTGPVAAAGGLPFTGSDALALAGIGMLLVLAGVAQRRSGATRRS